MFKIFFSSIKLVSPRFSKKKKKKNKIFLHPPQKKKKKDKNMPEAQKAANGIH